MPANLENSAVATGLEKVSFHYNSRERQRLRMLKLWHNCTHLSASKVMLKILQAILCSSQFSFQSQRKAMPKNLQTTLQLHSSHISKVMLKILQARLQQYMNQEPPDVQAGFRKGRGTRDQTANIC